MCLKRVNRDSNDFTIMRLDTYLIKEEIKIFHVL